MWPRILEFALTCWLALSRFIFRYDELVIDWAYHDLAIAFASAFFSIGSLYRPWNYIYLFNFLLSAWLFILGYIAPAGFTYPMTQNYMFLGLLTFMFTTLPNQTATSPLGWRE